MSKLKDKYINEMVAALKEKLGFTNVMSVPKCSKVVINMGFGIVDKDHVKSLAEDLGSISGQRPVVTKAKKSISNFKLREGMDIGAKVTLRGEKMYEFLDRLINAALPRIRDFRGLSPDSFDGFGNYSIGLTDQAIFPEIDPNDVSVAQGMDVTIVTTARNDNEGRELLRLIGIPFAEK
ncbi:MAG: 50S ribosomal protein L5 [Kiritimatiellae bacterium]|nr:50S ribosomal protein L5 [Kiritimatiellia bacterium]